MADSKHEAYDFTIQTDDGISFKLASNYKIKGNQLAVQIAIGNSKANITLKALTIIVRALNEAKSKHYDVSDNP